MFMRKLFFILASALIAIGVISKGHAADDVYGGVHLTVPFTMDSFGVHAIFRDNYGEVRTGIDTRGFWQAGGGLTLGDSDSGVVSGGIAYSSYQGKAVGYGGLRGGNSDGEFGVVTYGGDMATSYFLIGTKVGWDNDSVSAPVGPTLYPSAVPDPTTASVPVPGPTVPAPGPTVRPVGNDDAGSGGQGGGTSTGDTGETGHGRNGFSDGTNPGHGAEHANGHADAGHDNPHRPH